MQELEIVYLNFHGFLPLVSEERTRIVLEAVDRIEKGEENFIDKVIEFRREIDEFIRKVKAKPSF